MTTRLIDTEKMRAAFASVPLCRRTWLVSDEETSQFAMCAFTALVVFTGAMTAHEVDAIARGAMTVSQAAQLLAPILAEHYGIPEHIAEAIPVLFDDAPDEAAGCAAILAKCDAYNARLAA